MFEKFESIYTEYYPKSSLLPPLHYMADLVLDIKNEIKNKMFLKESRNKERRIEEINKIFDLFLNWDQKLNNSLNLINVSFLQKVFRLVILSINIEDRIYNYFSYREYIDNSNYENKIRFFMRDLDQVCPGLSLTKVVSNELSDNHLTNASQKPDYTGYGYVREKNLKMVGYIDNGWLRGKVRIIPVDSKPTYIIDNYEKHFDDYLNSLVK